MYRGCSVQQCAAQNLETPDFDLEVKTRSGERLWVNVSTLAFEEPRRNRRLVVHLTRDISRRKEERRSCLPGCWRSPKKWSPPPAKRNTRAAPVSPFSEQEQRILSSFAQAKNSSEIARELGITLPTPRNQRHSINEKLRTHNRLEAVMHAMQNALI